ncbi:lactonase family protein [Ramlibacter sp. G-1-2-2]|uniref:Lactonase family protein n=1 Tax=Ramlibacter agri TaxID=2728837 RepID=A0A848H8T7_9BURK|nr:beta-propeller fold lactonase family protein [Ramlibacter agri]NML44068.1 lactonase family protein [Ramlibacter agri]
MVAYVGSRTTRERNARGDGISVFAVDERTGALECIQVLGGLVNPSFLALNRAGTRLYAVHGDQQEASAFSVAADGRIALMNQVPCGGRNPVHLALDASERFLVVSNHLSGNLTVLGVEGDGALGAIVQQVALPGEPGPHRKEQPFSKPHFNPFDPSRRFVVVPDKGLDRIFCFSFEGGKLVAASDIETREGAGPRHVAFHPKLPLVYSVNELDSTVTVYRLADGVLQPLQWLPMLPADYCGNSRSAEIEVNAAGTVLYASNRGHDSIAAYAIDGDGLLRFLGVTPSGGQTPRFFTLAPDQRHLFVLNEDSDSIVTFAVDAQGALSTTGRAVSCGSPVCMVFRPSGSSRSSSGS